jgi:hypothetical protein
MNVIPCRSDYIITCDADATQIATKIELFIWKFGDTEPATPTKVIEKTSYSPTQYINYYNISPFVADYLKAFDIADMAVNVKIVKYYKLTTTWILDETIESIGVYGINTNSFTGYSFLCDINKIYTSQSSPVDFITLNTISMLFDFSIYSTLRVVLSSPLGTETIDYIETGVKFLNVFLSTDNPFFANGNDALIQYFNGTSFVNIINITGITPICEPKFEPFVVDYVNFYGGMSKFTFFKKNTKSWEVKGNEFQMSNVYPQTKTELKIFNKNGRDTIKLNTGWINEKYVQNIKELSLSEDLYLVGAISGFGGYVKLKTSSFETKTHLNNKMINYEMEFEFVSEII